jgi:outer membrane protein assembly factor BamD
MNLVFSQFCKILHKNIIMIFIIIIAISSCKSKNEEKKTASLEYQKAYKLMQKKDFIAAAEAFEKIDDDYPFSKIAVKANVMAIYCYYKQDNLSKIIEISDSFLSINPDSEYTPYVLYMKGLAYYLQIPNIKRAQDYSWQSSSAFRELNARFISSKYRQDAENRLEIIDEHLAGAKMNIARYQMQNNNFIGAINNFNDVTIYYSRTKQVAEAYFRLSEIYQYLGMEKQAKEMGDFLQNRFPESFWFNKYSKK